MLKGYLLFRGKANVNRGRLNFKAVIRSLYIIECRAFISGRITLVKGKTKLCFVRPNLLRDESKK